MRQAKGGGLKPGSSKCCNSCADSFCGTDGILSVHRDGDCGNMQTAYRMGTGFATTRPTMTSNLSKRDSMRRYAIGAELQPSGGTTFRVWAPDKEQVQLVLLDDSGAERAVVEMMREENGYPHSVRELATPAPLLWFSHQSRTGAIARSGVAVSAAGSHGAVASCRSAQLPVVRLRLERRVARKPSTLRDAHRHIHRRRHLLIGGRAVA